MEFGIKKICHAHYEKWEKRNTGRNITAKSRKPQNTWREKKLQALRNIGCGHHQTSRNDFKKF